MAKKEYGDNIKAEFKGKKLLIEIDTSKELGLSKSGKNMTVATTRGNQRLTDDEGNQFTLGLNCYKPKD